MRKTFVILFSVFVGAHTALWLVVYLVYASVGLSDQSPVFLLVVMLHILDSPARWVLTATSGAGNEFLLFLVGTIQWATVAGGVTPVFRIFARNVDSTTSPTIP